MPNQATREEQRNYGRGRTEVQRAEKTGNLSAIGKLQELLDKHEIRVSDLGSIEKIKVSEWQGMTKDKDGEPQVTDLQATSLVLSPSWDTGPKWPVVQPAKPVSVRIPKRTGPSLVGTWKQAFIVPDVQIGYWRLPSGVLHPFHDARAIDVGMQLLEVLRPDLSIIIGDYEDLPEMGKHRQHAGFAMTMQDAVDYGHELAAQIAAASGETRYLEGNHDLRIQNYITDNAKAAFGVKRPGDNWPAMSIPHLLKLDELGIRYVSGYPANATYINEKLAAIHGELSGPQIIDKLLGKEQISVLQGHAHTLKQGWRTRNSRKEPLFTGAWTVGTWGRIDGSVPDRAGVDIKGEPVKHWPNWQQGQAVVRYQPDPPYKFDVHLVPTFEGWAMFEGQEFTSTKDVNDG